MLMTILPAVRAVLAVIAAAAMLTFLWAVWMDARRKRQQALDKLQLDAQLKNEKIEDEKYASKLACGCHGSCGASSRRKA